MSINQMAVMLIEPGLVSNPEDIGPIGPVGPLLLTVLLATKHQYVNGTNTVPCILMDQKAMVPTWE
jgi:hypothetical protein